MKTSKYKNRFVIVYDTVCQGNQCVMDGDETALFESTAEAMKEVFDSALSMLLAQDAEALAELEVSPEQIKRMKEIDAAGDDKAMEEFFMENPQCNYNREWVEKAEDFIRNRKAIFTGKGLVITGKRLDEK